ncbi:MAG: CotH kinase family protein [Myxococcota bacterium]
MLGFLLACDTQTVVLGDEPPPVPGSEEIGDAAPPLPTEEEDDATPDADDLFELSRVHAVELALDEEAWDTLRASSYEMLYTGDCAEVPARVAIDGEWLPAEVGVSVKGRWGSGRTLDEKAALKVDLDAYDGDQRYLGLKALTLNNMVNDPSYTHEVLAYRVFEAAGVPSLRTGYAWVRMNGEDFGLYLNVETPDDEWLERVYAEPSGNLYDSDYLIWPDGSYTTVDFDTESQDFFDLEEGEDVGHADVHAVTDAISATIWTPRFHDTVGALVDWDEFLRYWAAEAWVGHWDGYNYNKNNYRVYFDPSSNRKAHVLPWGLDWTYTADPPLSEPLSRLGEGCLADAACAAALADALAEVCEAADGLRLQRTLRELTALVDPYVSEDPRREVDMATVRAYQEYTRSWIEGRTDFLLSR